MRCGAEVQEEHQLHDPLDDGQPGQNQCVNNILVRHFEALRISDFLWITVPPPRWKA